MTILHECSTRGPYILCVAISQDKRTVVFGDDERYVYSWDLDTETHNILAMHNSLLQSVAICPENRYAASGSGDGTVKIFDLENKTEKCTLNRDVDGVLNSIAIGKKYVIRGCTNKTKTIWEYAKKTLVRIIQNYEEIHSVAIVPSK